MYHVYVLRSDLEPELYIGHTDDLKRRINEHLIGSSRSSAHRSDWKLVHREEFRTRSLAIRRERYLKSGRGREVLTKYIPKSIGVIA